MANVFSLDHLMVFDIETVPDVSAVPNLLGTEAESLEEKHRMLTDYHLKITDGKNSFLRQPFHQIITISILIADINRTQQNEKYIFP